MNKPGFISLALGAIFTLTIVTIDEPVQVIESEKSRLTIPVPAIEKKEQPTESAKIASEQIKAEPKPEPIPYLPVESATREELQSMPPPISYSLLPLEDDQIFTSLFGSNSLSSPLNIGTSTLLDELTPEEECNNHDAIVYRPCTPLLVIDQKNTTLFSMETREKSTGYQIDCDSLLGNLNKYDENSVLKEQCIGGINIDGKNWSLEFRGAVTYRFDTNSEEIEIKPCPEGDITECTTVGVRLRVDIP